MQILSRVAATQATVDRFKGVVFSWGTNDCAHLVAHHLRQMGYEDPLAGTKTYGTLRNAKKAMKEAGVESLTAYLDERFERIAPAQCLDGDIVSLVSGTDGLEALGVYTGKQRILGFGPVETANGVAYHCLWTDESGMALCEAAWRVPPLTPPPLKGEF